MMLREADGSLPTLNDLSRVLKLTPRTLNRRLARDGERFLDLVKRVRSERACALLRDGRLPVTQIAYQLGYRDSVNFSRAFRRELGMTPSEYRRRSIWGLRFVNAGLRPGTSYPRLPLRAAVRYKQVQPR
jgi:AraC-like DNA-binding protein